MWSLEKDGMRVAIEIETGKSDAVYNVKKDLDAGFTEIVVCSLNEKTRKEILLQIERNKNVSVVLARDMICD